MSNPKSALIDTQNAQQETRDRNPGKVRLPKNKASLDKQAAGHRHSTAFENTPAEALEKLLKHHSGTQQLVLLQDFPDPDALSSAWTYRLIEIGRAHV